MLQLTQFVMANKQNGDWKSENGFDMIQRLSLSTKNVCLDSQPTETV